MKQLLIFSIGLMMMLAGVKTVNAADLPGKWHFVLDTPGGDREMDASFVLTGDKVTGKWAEADVAGTFQDGKLNLAFPMHSEEGGIDGTFKVVGKLDADGLSGTWEFSEYSGTFKAAKKE